MYLPALAGLVEAIHPEVQAELIPAASTRTWIDAHTDQAIILGSLALGLGLIGNSLYLIVA